MTCTERLPPYGPPTLPYRPARVQVKLYFMIGLPGETDEDVMGIAETIEWLQRECRTGGATPHSGRSACVPCYSTVRTVTPHHVSTLCCLLCTRAWLWGTTTN